jgi:recombining binding protein (suppressor of hairless)
MPITPFPTLFTSPVYRPPTNTLELTVSNFFYDDVNSRQRLPLDIYLGSLGPLRARVYEAAPPGPLTNISSFGPGGTEGGAMPEIGNPNTQRYIHSPLHTIVIVELPALTDVVAALQEPPRPATPAEGGDDSHKANGKELESGKSEARTPPQQQAVPPPHTSLSGGVVPPELAGRSLPLLFIRSSDGIGYHSGRTVAVENVFHGVDFMAGAPQNGQPAGVNSEWLAAAAAQAAQDGGLHGWTLRVM